jgi:hypothetical protein
MWSQLKTNIDDAMWPKAVAGGSIEVHYLLPAKGPVEWTRGACTTRGENLLCEVREDKSDCHFRASAKEGGCFCPVLN